MPITPGAFTIDNYIKDVVVGEVALTTTPVECKVGATILDGRSQLVVMNDASNLVYLHDNASFTPGIDQDVITLLSGQEITFDVRPYPLDGVPVRIYAAVNEIPTSIRVMEVK